ncbi:class I SAM-dependent methyltransferase [Candidatus Pelagibacter communis]|uniref:class I SAM-dependent methyltransferase n=1 Tax=Pelagibacter ubique TaxID=198252 RepID=UPI0009E57195|nr:class I SAM-dependent methyltransferase [Candidatus Pelagibacter ubique]
MFLIKFLQKKIIRFLNSEKLLKIFFYYHKFFNNKGLKDIGFDFTSKKDRKFIVQDIINKQKFKKYLEIGCFDNELFDEIKIENKTGVDPVSGGTIRLTSDQFFKNNKEFFDCVFIDGLHTYNQVKKDIKNSLDFLNDNGIILLHDCLPNNFYEQATPRCQWTWNGDVWKAIVECRTDKHLDVYTCYADFGIGVILKRPNKNLLNYHISDFSKLKFDEYHKDPYHLMNIIEYDELKKIL